MYSVQAMLRRAERDAAVIDAVRPTLTTLRLLQVEHAKSAIWIDVRKDIERLIEVLALLGGGSE